MVQQASKALLFRNEEEKALFLDGAAREDATDPNQPEVRTLAKRLLAAHPHVEDFVRSVQRFVRDSIRYVRDTNRFLPGGKGEQFADSGVILRRGFDDCDGKARLVIALLLCGQSLNPALRIDARMRPVWRRKHWTHAQAEARWPGSERLRSLDGKRKIAEPDGWILIDAIVKGLAMGENPERMRDPKTGKIPVW